ncbi:MAG TPA: ankyrin repeat domain-containing protein [Gemmatimonadaceae bacterium]|nr:ankyrin repeat domain-containing protein [Gemmatimonadaceae bacterium]
MSSAPRRTLPAHPDLEQQKKLAKELLRAFRAGDRDAISRIRAELPDKADISLADAQFVLAREYGVSSWRELRERILEQRAVQQPPIERFKRAVQAGDASTVRSLIEAHAVVRSSLDAPIFSFDAPALLAAIPGGHVDVIDTLLEFGADPNRRSDWWAGGFHPLHSARGDIAERLITAGAIPDACAAANLDRADLLSAILAEDPGRVHERGGDGMTPLHFARSRDVIDLLLSAGADPDARDIDHRATAAQHMLGGGDGESRIALAGYLVERGASADIFLAAALGLTGRVRAMLEADPGLLSLRTSQGEYGEQPPSSFHIYLWTIGPNLTPLQVAAKFGQAETLAVMERFASPEERLLLACHRGDADGARAIAASHPGIVAQLQPESRRALTDEAWNANAPAVELLLELGFDPAIPSASGAAGASALHCAAWQGAADCVAAILRVPAGRALIDARDAAYRGTPLNWCCHGSVNCGNRDADHATVARLLLAAGAHATPEMADWEGSAAFQAVIDEALRGG